MKNWTRNIMTALKAHGYQADERICSRGIAACVAAYQPEQRRDKRGNLIDVKAVVLDAMYGSESNIVRGAGYAERSFYGTTQRFTNNQWLDC